MSFIPKELDLDRLHKATDIIVNGGYRYRQEGKTVAYLMLMLGEAQLGDRDNKYWYIGHSRGRAKAVAEAFAELLRQEVDIEPISYVGFGRIELDYGPSFTFTSYEVHKSAACGARFNRVFMDLDNKLMDKLESDGKLAAFSTDVLCTLIGSNGDII